MKSPPEPRNEAKEAAELARFPPYTRVRLKGLKVNTDLNGLCGIVTPPELSQSQNVPGTVKVRLESMREVAVRPPNLDSLDGVDAGITPEQQMKLRQINSQVRIEAEGSVQERRAAAAAAVAAAAEAAAREVAAAASRR